jgi:hypothetical protein
MAAVDVKRKMRAEENEGLGVTELGPAVIRIPTIIIENADFACNFPNHVVFLHGIQSLDKFPGRMLPANVNRWVRDGIGCQSRPAGFVESGIGPIESILSPAVGHS